MPLVRITRGWTGLSMARFGPGDLADFSDEEAATIVAAQAGHYVGDAILEPPKDKMVKGPTKMKAAS